MADDWLGHRCIDFPEGGSGQAKSHQVAAGRGASNEGAKGCSNRAGKGQLHRFHSVSWAGGKLKKADKILFRHLHSYFLQSWGTKEMPLDFEGLLSSTLFLREGGQPQRI